MGNARSVTVELIRSGQPRAYADSIYEAYLTFSVPEGQVWASKFCWAEGEQLKTWRETVEENGGTVIFESGKPTTRKEVYEGIVNRVKPYVQLMVHEFHDGPDRQWHQPWLEKLEYLGEGKWHAVVISPYLD